MRTFLKTIVKKEINDMKGESKDIDTYKPWEIKEVIDLLNEDAT